MLVSEWGMNFSASQELTTTKITPTNPKVSEAPAFFSKSRSNTLLLAQELSAVLNNQTRMKGCEQLFPKGLEINKGHISKARREGDEDNGVWEEQFRSGEGDWRYFFFPDGFQRKEICVVCCGAENTVQGQ